MISVILPTINESENLQILIPRLKLKLSNEKINDYEILILDDGSTDETEIIISEMNHEDNRIKLISRTPPHSLPMSIWEGIEISNKDYVLWMDADGSMTPEAFQKILNTSSKNPNSIVIGSRFAKGGGYKGVKDIGKKSIFKAIKNVRKSNDSVMGMLVSIIFNKFLYLIYPIDVKDITSGFILGKKEYFTKEPFERSSYGEYFLYLILELQKKNINMIEVGYLCETRATGESKTANSIFQLFRRGMPYIYAAIISRREIKN